MWKIYKEIDYRSKYLIDRYFICPDLLLQFYFNADLYSQSVAANWIIKGKQNKLFLDGNRGSDKD